MISSTWIPGPVVASSQNSSAPVLRVGDTWTYHHSKGFNSTRSIDRIDHLSSPQSGCFAVGTERDNSRWTSEWISTDWVMVQAEIQTSNYTVTDTYSQGLRIYDWPLTVGKSWSSDTTVIESIIGVGGSHTSHSNLSDQRTVTGYANVTVPAGTFRTLLVEAYLGGQLVFRDWVNYDTKMPVQEVGYYPDGRLYDTVQLVSYNRAPSTARSAADCPDSSISGQLLSFLLGGQVPPYLVILGLGVASLAVVTARRTILSRRARMQPPDPI